MKTASISIIPFGLAARREESRRELLDILATVNFWRLRAVEFTLLSLIIFWLCFVIAARL